MVLGMSFWAKLLQHALGPDQVVREDHPRRLQQVGDQLVAQCVADRVCEPPKEFRLEHLKVSLRIRRREIYVNITLSACQP